MDKKKVSFENFTVPKPSTKRSKGKSSGRRIGSGSIKKVVVDLSLANVSASASSDSGSNSSSTNDHVDVRELTNPWLFSAEFTRILKEIYGRMPSYKHNENGIEVSIHPFRHGIIPNFVSSKKHMTWLENKLKKIKVQQRFNDLLKFRQSFDLNDSKSKTLQRVRSQLQYAKDFISNVTGIPLNSKVDIFCSRYRYTDVLLCHDDRLETRRIAFIYYLVPDTWNESDGGALALFDTDDNGQPKSVVKSIVPKRNNFVFFEVSAESFHQVVEVVSEDKLRLSLTGWFHGPPLPRTRPPVENIPPTVPYGNIEEDVFYSWFNPAYLSFDTQCAIKKRFQKDSFIMLTNFLEMDKYAQLKSALESSDIKWNVTGPAIHRCLLSADKNSLPPIVQEYLRVIRSDAFFLVLSHLCALKLHPLSCGDEPENVANGASSSSSNGASSSNGVLNPRCRSEVQMHKHGSYSLARDTDPDLDVFTLDTILYLGCGKVWNPSGKSGVTNYVAKGDPVPLLEMRPQDNALTVVYKDKGCMRFLKYMDHKTTKLPSPQFYEVHCVYYE